MFALRVTYLTGRVYAAAFEDGDTKARVEWPPHPSRLFSALTAAWGEGGAEEDLRSALEWLEQQSAPRILAGDRSPRDRVQAFVPVNDEETLPEGRSRKPRVFPSASLIDPDVYFVWEATAPEEVRAALDRILLRTSSLGHSSSLVSVEIADTVNPRDRTEWLPHASRGDRMRIPSPGRLHDLTERYRRFEASGSKVHRPTAGSTALYAPAGEPESKPVRGIFYRMIVLRREFGAKASLRSALSVTTALRKAIQSKSPQPPPECISGHAPGSTEANPLRSDRSHMAVIPLPFTGSRHATGELMGAAVLLPENLTREERDLCWRAVSEVEELTMPWGAWRVSLTDAEETRIALQPRTWTRPHTVWATVTPFVFDRFPKEPYGPEAERIVREAMQRVGLPEPVDVDLHYNPWHAGVPKASAFPAAPARPGKPQRYHCHVRVKFDRRIAGPLIAGAGRHYGYGLFRALDREAE